LRSASMRMLAGSSAVAAKWGGSDGLVRGLERVEQFVDRGKSPLRVGQVEIETQFVLTVQPVLPGIGLDQPDQRRGLDAGVGAEQEAAAGGIGLDAANAEAR